MDGQGSSSSCSVVVVVVVFVVVLIVVVVVAVVVAVVDVYLNSAVDPEKVVSSNSVDLLEKKLGSVETSMCAEVAGISESVADEADVSLAVLVIPSNSVEVEISVFAS